MKKCEQCGRPYDAVFDECPDCDAARFERGDEVLIDGARVAQIAEIAPPSRVRPTGETVLAAGAVGLTVGLLLSFLTDLYSALFFVGVGLANLGLLGLVAGYIVHAISFLPGKAD